MSGVLFTVKVDRKMAYNIDPTIWTMSGVLVVNVDIGMTYNIDPIIWRKKDSQQTQR